MRFVGGIAWRYSFGVKRRGFARLVSILSMFGMGLGVASLIIVLSVMNGFADEITRRVLSVVPHIFIVANSDALDAPSVPEVKPNPGVRESGMPGVPGPIRTASGVLAATPYVRDQVLFDSGYGVSGARLMGLDPRSIEAVSPWLKTVASSLEGPTSSRFEVVLSESLSIQLGVGQGDNVKVMLPELSMSPFGMYPRTRLLRVAAVFSPGINQLSADAFVTIETAQRLFRRSFDGWQLRVEDMWQAPRIARELSNRLGSDFRVQDWTQTQGTLFASITMEKRMVGLLLFLVVIVAAFNLIATLAMSVHSRRRDIAVLGMMGLSRWSIGKIFVFQGVLMSGVAITLGLLLGTVVATFLPSIVVFVETTLNFHLFDPSVYFITKLPSDTKVTDLIWVGLSALILSCLASLYPALRASRILPAEVLRYE